MDTSRFEYTQDYVDTEFCKVCRGCIMVYNSIIKSQCRLTNDENLIRDEFMKYLKNPQYRRSHTPLNEFHFEKEVPEYTGRADIKVMPRNGFEDDYAYYIIECKRLDNNNTSGITGLNAEYIKNGICRFVTGFYSTYNDCCGMLGFVVDKMDIHKNTCGNINDLLPQTMTNDRGGMVNANAIMPLTNTVLTNDFYYSYISQHLHTNEQRRVTIYHLMFDFSDIILKSPKWKDLIQSQQR